MEDLYSLVANADFFGGTQVQIALVGFFALVVGLFQQSKVFQRLVGGSRTRKELDLRFAAYGVPLLIVLMELQRVRGRGGGLLRFLGIVLVVVIVVVIGVLALIAFLVYRFLIRRGRR